MNPPALFGLAVRLLGLVVLYRTIGILAQVVVATTNTLFFGSPPAALLDPLLLLGIHAVLVVWLVRGAPPLTGVAYPPGR